VNSGKFLSVEILGSVGKAGDTLQLCFTDTPLNDSWFQLNPCLKLASYSTNKVQRKFFVSDSPLNLFLFFLSFEGNAARTSPFAELEMEAISLHTSGACGP
jgi:hypothetical protein